MKKYLIAIILITMYSCSWVKNKEENIIEEKQFVDLLIDIHLADAVVSNEGYKLINDSVKLDLYYDYVLKKHNISRNKFKQTVIYYTKKPNEYNKIYEQVLEKLSKQEEEVKTK